MNAPMAPAATGAAPARENPFNAKLVFGLVAAGIAAFAALVLLIAFGNRIGPIHDNRAPALSVAATGFKGLVMLSGHFRETREISGEADLAILLRGPDADLLLHVVDVSSERASERASPTNCAKQDVIARKAGLLRKQHGIVRNRRTFLHRGAS